MTTEIRPEPKAKLGERIADVRSSVSHLGSGLADGGKAYVAGILDLGRTLGGFGRELADELGQHVRASVNARSLREVAELQAAFAQHRVEMAATHSKEFVDLARARSEAVIAPLAALVRQDKAA